MEETQRTEARTYQALLELDARLDAERLERTTAKHWGCMEKLSEPASRKRLFKAWAKELVGRAREADLLEDFIEREFNTKIELRRRDWGEPGGAGRTGKSYDGLCRIHVDNWKPGTPEYRDALLWGLAMHAVAERTNYGARDTGWQWAHELATMIDRELDRRELCMLEWTEDFVAAWVDARDRAPVVHGSSHAFVSWWDVFEKRNPDSACVVRWRD